MARSSSGTHFGGEFWRNLASPILVLNVLHIAREMQRNELIDNQIT